MWPKSDRIFVAFFKCTVCGTESEAPVQDGRIKVCPVSMHVFGFYHGVALAHLHLLTGTDILSQCELCHATLNEGSALHLVPAHAIDTLMMSQIIHNRSRFADKQLVKLQENPGHDHILEGCTLQVHLTCSGMTEAIPDGETPHTVNLCVFDTLVDVGKPGDRVEVRF